jgi:hypothetical protein
MSVGGSASSEAEGAAITGTVRRLPTSNRPAKRMENRIEVVSEQLLIGELVMVDSPEGPPNSYQLKKQIGLSR